MLRERERERADEPRVAPRREGDEGLLADRPCGRPLARDEELGDAVHQVVHLGDDDPARDELLQQGERRLCVLQLLHSTAGARERDAISDGLQQARRP